LWRSVASGSDALTRTEIDHWITFSGGPLACATAFGDAVAYLDSVLAPDAILKASERAFLVGDAVSAADFAVYAALWLSPFWQVSYKQ
jgi:glutathione S-transferase